MAGNNPYTMHFHELAVRNAIIARSFGMSVKTYKLIKATTQLTAVAAGIYAMSLGADPLITFVLVAGIVSGPEVFEMLLTSQDAPGG